MASPTLVMGFAGHVDHGKTSLVKALTGVDLDTLPEEKARGLTINLGFTYFDSPSGKRIGVVDVPGHRRFIKTMLAGAHGIDFALLLIAADDSVMPQTREHMEILSLLGVEQGIVVITKVDLVDDELLELCEAEVVELIEGTFLEGAAPVKVSNLTGQGMPELAAAIDELAGSIKAKGRGSYFRMFVDRAFTIAGTGTVVTGVGLAGTVSPGDELEVLPAGGIARTRKIEVHGDPVERARAGQRTAINLRLVGKAEVKKGDMLATPGIIKPTYMVDARIEVLADYKKPLEHWTRVRFYIGSAETFGRVVVLDAERIEPGDSAFAQLRMESPIPAVVNDPFIIRDFSASWTIGGGRILDAHPTKHKRKKLLAAVDLETRESGYLEEIVELEVKKAGYFAKRSDVAADLDAPADRVGQAAAALAGQGRVVVLPPRKSPWLAHGQAWKKLAGKVREILAKHHQDLPQLETGLSMQELLLHTGRAIGQELLEEPFRHAIERLAEDRVLKLVEATYALSEHAASLGASDQEALARVRAAYSDDPLKPPLTEDAYKMAGLPRAVVRDFIDRLIEDGTLVRVSREFLFDRAALESARDSALDFIATNGKMTVAEFRDLVGVTRKFAIPLLNYFDNEGYTIRDGDYRVKGPRA